MGKTFAGIALGMALVSGEVLHAAHGIALGAALKYPATFTHFDYVNPQAPKGGKSFAPGFNIPPCNTSHALT